MSPGLQWRFEGTHLKLLPRANIRGWGAKGEAAMPTSERAEHVKLLQGQREGPRSSSVERRSKHRTCIAKIKNKCIKSFLLTDIVGKVVLGGTEMNYWQREGAAKSIHHFENGQSFY